MRGVSPRDFAWHVAKALQEFSPSRDLSYPPFLLHGLTQPALEGFLEKIAQNSRILRETLAVEESITCEPEIILDSLSLEMKYKDGLVYALEKDTSVIAFAEVFLDTTLRDLYVFTLQEKGMFTNGEEKSMALREYNTVGNKLGMSPRRFILARLLNFAQEREYKRLRVVRPEGHPLFLGRYNGFFEHYTSAIKKAGVVDGRGCYLEKRL